MCGIDETIEPLKEGENLEVYIADQMHRKREEAITKWIADRAAEGIVLSPGDVCVDFVDMKRNEAGDTAGNVCFSATWRIKLSPEYYARKTREIEELINGCKEKS